MNALNMTALKRTSAASLLVAGALMCAPAFAEVDLSGMWAAREHQDWMERLPGPDPVDYLGLPINEAAREKALLFDYSIMSQQEHQCGYYTAFYNALGPQGLKIWSENDPVRGNRVVAWKLSGFIDIDVTTIYMDGRPHPSKNTYYPYSGFTTGKWEGDVLTTYTTHIKSG
jgi:hypothetical protein